MFERVRSRREILLVAVLWGAPVLFFAARRGRATAPAAGARRLPSGNATAPAAGVASPDRQVRSSAARANAAALQNLPYILQSHDARSDWKGVIENRKDLASPGLNFFFPWSLRRSGRAYLMDMSGAIVWRWSVESYLARQETRPWIGHFEFLPDGSLIAVLQNDSLLKIDRDSRIVWQVRIRAHHDLWADPGGDLYALAHDVEQVPDIHPTRPIESDAIVVLSAGGVVKRKIPVLGLLRRSGYSYLLPRLHDVDIAPSIGPLDVFHLNHVEAFDGSLARRSPMFQKGNLLISIRNLNAIAIVDWRTEKIVWLWGPGNLTFQHHPRLLPDGHILIFDNGTTRSQIIEMDPLGLRVTWRYAPPSEFFSRIAGGVQRLGNGNTLITESMKGYAFEVTPAGETVWKYANPEINPKGLRNGVIRMTRVDRSALTFLPVPGVASR